MNRSQRRQQERATKTNSHEENIEANCADPLLHEACQSTLNNNTPDTIGHLFDTLRLVALRIKANDKTGELQRTHFHNRFLAESLLCQVVSDKFYGKYATYNEMVSYIRKSLENLNEYFHSQGKEIFSEDEILILEDNVIQTILKANCL